MWKILADTEKPKRSKSKVRRMAEKKCNRCGEVPKVSRLTPFFGPYRDKILCSNCWNELNKSKFYRFRQSIDYHLRKISFLFTGRM